MTDACLFLMSYYFWHHAHCDAARLERWLEGRGLIA